MPEFFEVNLMAAILRLSLIGRYLSPEYVQHYVRQSNFPSKEHMLDAAFRRVEYVYATGKTIVIVLQHFDGKIRPCLLIQPLQYGFITVFNPELVDKCPISRGKQWQSKEIPDTQKNGVVCSKRTARSKGANVGYEVRLLGSAHDLRMAYTSAIEHLADDETPWWKNQVPVFEERHFDPGIADFVRVTGLEYQLDTYLQGGNSNTHICASHTLCAIYCVHTNN